MEFLIGFLLGAARDRNPLHFALGTAGLSVLVAVLVGLYLALVALAPHAVALLDAVGISQLLPFMPAFMVDAQREVGVLDASLSHLLSTTVVCVVAMCVVGVGLLAITQLIGLVLKAIGFGIKWAVKCNKP